jgi:Flp pilus assembly protein TadG
LLKTLRFVRDERGSATIEFVLWVPVFVILLVATTDASILYLHHTEMWNVSRDVARRVSVGDMTEAQAADKVQSEMFLSTNAYTVETSNPAELDVWIKITTSVRDASVFGFFEPVLGRSLVAEVTMRREPI